MPAQVVWMFDMFKSYGLLIVLLNGLLPATFSGLSLHDVCISQDVPGICATVWRSAHDAVVLAFEK